LNVYLNTIIQNNYFKFGGFLWQYYFAAPSIMHAINTKFGFSSINLTEYEGILLETLNWIKSHQSKE